MIPPPGPCIFAGLLLQSPIVTTVPKDGNAIYAAIPGTCRGLLLVGDVTRRINEGLILEFVL